MVLRRGARSGGGQLDVHAALRLYTTNHAWTYSLNTESTYDWAADEWSVPLNFLVSKLITIDKKPISLGAGIRYWADIPTSRERSEGIGGRAILTFLFPTGK